MAATRTKKKTATTTTTNTPVNGSGEDRPSTVEPKTLEVEVSAKVQGSSATGEETATTSRRTTTNRRSRKTTSSSETPTEDAPKPTSTVSAAAEQPQDAFFGAHLREASQQVEDMARQTREAGENLRAVREEHEQLRTDLGRLREEVRTAQELLLRDVQEASERVQQHTADIVDQLGSAKQLFRQSEQQFLVEFEGSLGQVRREVQQASQLVHALPLQARELGDRLAEIARHLPEAERQLTAVQAESLQAEQWLEAIQQKTAATEERLISARRELAEAMQRLQQTRMQIQDSKREASEAQEETEQARQLASEAIALAALPIDVRSRLGVTAEPGVVVAEVLPDSPASVAGFVRGDVITSVNGRPVLTGLEFRQTVHSMRDGEELTIQMTRAGQPREFQAQRIGGGGGGQLSEGNQLGVAVEPGVVVADVLEGGSAAVAGLNRGDVITAVNETPILTGEQLRQAVQPLPVRSEVSLEVCQAGQVRRINVKLDEPGITTTTTTPTSEPAAPEQEAPQFEH